MNKRVPRIASGSAQPDGQGFSFREVSSMWLSAAPRFALTLILLFPFLNKGVL